MKAYASVPADLPQEERFRILVEKFLQARYAAAGRAEPQPDKAAMDAMETAVLDGIEAAGEAERAPESEKISTLMTPNPEDENLRQRAMNLEHVVAQYTAELRQWESLEADLLALASGIPDEQGIKPDGIVSLPPLPSMDSLSLLGLGKSEARPPVADAVESFVLHTDDVNYSLKRLEAQHEVAANLVSSVTKSINSSVFDGGLLDLDASKIVPSPRPRSR